MAQAVLTGGERDGQEEARRCPWLVEPVLQLTCLCCGGAEVAGVLAIIPSQASLSGGCRGILVQLNLGWGQQDMPHRAGGSSLDIWECVSAVRLV